MQEPLVVLKYFTLEIVFTFKTNRTSEGRSDVPISHGLHAFAYLPNFTGNNRGTMGRKLLSKRKRLLVNSTVASMVVVDHNNTKIIYSAVGNFECLNPLPITQFLHTY